MALTRRADLNGIKHGPWRLKVLFCCANLYQPIKLELIATQLTETTRWKLVQRLQVDIQTYDLTLGVCHWYHIRVLVVRPSFLDRPPLFCCLYKQQLYNACNISFCCPLLWLVWNCVPCRQYVNLPSFMWPKQWNNGGRTTVPSPADTT